MADNEKVSGPVNGMDRLERVAGQLAAAFESLLKAFDGDNSVSAKYLAKRVEELHGKCDRLVTTVAELDKRVHMAMTRLDNASELFKAIRDRVEKLEPDE